VGDQIKKNEINRVYCPHGRSTYRILVRKSERKRLLGRCRNGQKDNIKIDHKGNLSVWIGFI
jgi:hypothetical protein